jgi:uncharacterized protein YlxP (DUF503 family)
MTIGLLRIELLIIDANNLKDKRGVMRSIIDNLRRRFNISVLEEGNNKWRRTILSIAHLSSNRAVCSGALNKIVDYIRENPRVEIINYSIELL